MRRLDRSGVAFCLGVLAALGATHGRNSINGAGGSVLGVARLDVGFENAFWNGGVGAMFFGDGLPFARALDFAVLRRARLSLAPGIAEVCAAASPL